jgi:NIMA (never in mitosis gene a)-related kinase
VIAKERELTAREAAFMEKESHMHNTLLQKDAEIASLQHHVIESRSIVEARIKEAITKREEELRVAVMRREEEVAIAMARREEEIMGAVQTREEEIYEAWREREEQIRKEVNEAVEEKMKWVKGREEELEAEKLRLDSVRVELEAKVRC